MITETATGSAFEAFFAEGAARAARVDREFVDLWAAMVAAGHGGKLLRPALLRTTYEALGGTDAALARHVGDAVELLHTAFLMHDDVIDGDLRRRGRPNVSGTFTSRARFAGAPLTLAAGYGRTAGILAGDLALAGAVRMVARTPADPGTVDRLLDLLDEAIQVTAAGELADVRLSLHVDRPDLTEVLAMEERKTAVYSFCLPLQAGAVLAGADDATVARLGELGRLVGVAFQLQDDLLGVFGDEAQTGKSTLTDLREGKVTALVAHARTTPAWTRISRFVGDRTLSTAHAALVREQLTRAGSRRFVEDLVADHLGAARLLAAQVGLGADLVERLTAVVPESVPVA